MRMRFINAPTHTSKLQLSAMGPRLLELLALLVDALNLGRLGWLVQGWP